MRARVRHARVAETDPAVSDLQAIVASYERIDRFLGYLRDSRVAAGEDDERDRAAREARMVRLRGSATGDDLLSYREEADARQAAEARTAALEARIREPEDALAAPPKSNEP